MSESRPTTCPSCNAPLAHGRIAGAAGAWVRSGTIDWIQVSPDGEEHLTFMGGGEELAPHPPTSFSASPRFDAARCGACRLVLFWY